MHVYEIQEKLMKENPKYMKKMKLQDMFKKVAEQNAQQSSTLDIPGETGETSPSNQM